MLHLPVRNRFRLSAKCRSIIPGWIVDEFRERVQIAELRASAARASKSAILGLLGGLMRLPMLILITGPKVLLTSHISGKCAALMMMLCTPSLLLCSILTIPAFLFQSPQQQAYFYFAKIINQDPSRWLVLTLAGICAVLALAIPATTSESRASAAD